MGLNSWSSLTRWQILSTERRVFRQVVLRPDRAAGTRAAADRGTGWWPGALEFGEDADEILALVGEEFGERLFAIVGLLGQDHLAHGIDAIAFEEHVFGAAEADAGGAEGDGVGGLLGGVGVGADLEAADFAAPVHEFLEQLIGRAFFGFEGFFDEDLDDLGGGGLISPG
jgi:hypothetical protein